jgi:O-antigen ligase
MLIITGWHQKYIQEGNLDFKELILLFMAAVYPLIVLPDPVPFLLSMPEDVYPNYFLGARYIAFVVISLTALFIILKERKVTYQQLFIPLAFFLLFATISASLAPLPFVAWIGSPFRFTGVFTYYFCVILFFLALSSTNVEKVLNYMVIAAAVVSLTGVMQYFGIELFPHRSISSYVSCGTMWHHNILGTYTSFLLPAAVLKYMSTKRFSWLVLMGMIYSGLLVSLTRGSWIGFLVGFIIIGIFTWNKAGLKITFTKTIIMFALITIILLPMQNNTLMNRFVSVRGEEGVGVSDNAGSYRVFIWKETSKIFLDNWLFGIGPDHLVFANIIKPDSSSFDKAHNIFLETAVTMGIFTLISYLVFLSGFFKDYKNEKTFICKTMILVYLIQGLFSVEVIMVMPLFWIVLGLSLASQNFEREMIPS